MKALQQIKRSLLNQDQIDDIFQRFHQYNNKPTIELEYVNNFTLLVAIILSAQTTDVSVNKITCELFKIADTPQKMLALGEENLKLYINKIGLFNSKSKNIINLCRIIIADYQSQVPADFECLVKLPGVGRKSANVFLNTAFGLPTMAVDTHVFRVSNRIGLVATKTVLATEKNLLSVIPKKWLKYAHHWLVLHGRYICKARKPLCNQCIISDLCQYTNKNI